MYVVTVNAYIKREEEHLAAVREAIDKRGTLDHSIVHGVFVGPARSGKDSLMKRLLGKMPSTKSPSTGVAERVLLIRVEKSSKVMANVEKSKWSQLKFYDEEAIDLMVKLTLKCPRERSIQLNILGNVHSCLLYTSPSPRDATLSRMPSSA